MSVPHILDALSARDRASFERFLERATYPAGATIVREGVREGDLARAMFFVLEGEARLMRADLDLGRVGAGDHFGELGLLAGRCRAASVIAATPMTVARLDRARWDALRAAEPAVAAAFVEAVVSRLAVQLTEMTDSVGTLLRERSLPRHVEVEVTLGDERRVVRTGTLASELLPETIDGARVVAALVNRKAVPLSTPIGASVRLEPLTTAHWEGERILRESTALLLLEAAATLDGDLVVRVEPSMGAATWIEVRSRSGRPVDRDAVARDLAREMQARVDRDVAFHEEWWTAEEASAHFEEVGWDEAVKLLRTWPDATVPLVTCGRVYAISMAPLVHRARLLDGFELRPTEEGLVLLTGEPPPNLSSRTAWVEVMQDHERWLTGLGATSVGAFNVRSIEGDVAETIRVAEGFHEKRLGQIADQVERRGDVRVVFDAGPSSSGKTTFLKRLRVQLQVVGIDPVVIGLDDYYVDRERTVRGPDGDYDYEALEALDLPLLREHVARLLRGEVVRTARYDFVTGTSHPEGGPTSSLKPGSVLMLEGIHGLNPALLGDVVPRAQAFRIFIQPMTSLALDALSRVSPSDLRLLRRIVRDRRARGCSPGDNILRWRSVRRGERLHIFPYVDHADVVFDTSLVYELSVLKTYAERYLLEVPSSHPAHPTAARLRHLVERFVAIDASHVPGTSILREFIGESGFES